MQELYKYLKEQSCITPWISMNILDISYGDLKNGDIWWCFKKAKEKMFMNSQLWIRLRASDFLGYKAVYNA